MKGTGPNLVVSTHPRITSSFILTKILPVRANGFLWKVTFPIFLKNTVLHVCQLSEVYIRQ